MRQRLFPVTAGERQGVPARVFAPQRGLPSIGPVLRLWVPTILRRAFVIGIFVRVRSWLVPLDRANDCLATSLDLNVSDHDLLRMTAAFTRLNKVDKGSGHFLGVP